MSYAHNHADVQCINVIIITITIKIAVIVMVIKIAPVIIKIFIRNITVIIFMYIFVVDDGVSMQALDIVMDFMDDDEQEQEEEIL